MHKWLDRAEAENDMGHYFAELHQGANNHAVYSGRCFERLDGGRDQPHVSDRFTAAYLVAVQMLGVDVPPETVIALCTVGWDPN